MLSSKRPLAWLMISELGTPIARGPLNPDTCGPDRCPEIDTWIGHPLTGILLKETLITWSHASTGTNETANLRKKESNDNCNFIANLKLNNLLRIAFRVNLCWNVMASRRNGDLEISFTSIACVNSKLYWMADWSFCYRSHRHLVGIVRFWYEWCSFDRHSVVIDVDLMTIIMWLLFEHQVTRLKFIYRVSSYNERCEFSCET